MRMRWSASAAWGLVLAIAAGRAVHADDLNPVTVKAAPAHAPVVLVKDGRPKAHIAVAVPPKQMSRVLKQAIQDLQKHIKRTTGATLPIRYGKTDGVAIVVGDCGLAASSGLVGAKMPIEGFAIKTTPSAVLIVGHDTTIDKRTASDGTAWGVYEFLERFVGVRWYYPSPSDLGTSIHATKDLVVPPVWLEDAPVFRKREVYPPMAHPSNGTGLRLTPHHNRLRAGNSWPVSLVVHSPRDWDKVYAKDRPECFQQRADGGREFRMLCYGHPRTLETYLENIAAHFDRGEKAHMGIVGNAITVSPNDASVVCRCAYCRKLWDDKGGALGTASRIMAQFVAKLSREVKRRWPGKIIIFLPYVNYTMPPEGITFADNVEVQMCGMPGLAQYKEPAIAASEQAGIDGWVRITGRQIQNWHYSCWPENKTKAVYLFPHTIQDFYQRNRDKVVGSFINGVKDHWPRQHISLYVWMKVLWNPDFDVSAAITEYCRRLYGPGAKTMHELITLQIDGWEKNRWPGAALSPKTVYESSYPRKTVVRMEQLLEQARRKAKGDVTALERIDYYAAPFAEFFAESKDYAEGTGRTTLVAQKAGENPAIDGKLDDNAWKTAKPVSFVRAMDKKVKSPRFPTALQAVWTADGVTFGFRMAEPAPGRLVRDIRGHDDPMLWWNDNVEIFLDVTGQRTGYYQLIVNPNGAVFDSRGTDTTWTCRGLKTRAHVGKDFWSLEVFVPYAAFSDAVVPATGVVWYANFTRHRLGDKKPREYQRLNTTYEGPSRNMMAFGPIRFVE